MTQQTLTRTNKRPLAFLGEEIASDSTRGLNSTRWQKCTVYRTNKGKIVVGIGNLTCWQGESDHYTAEVFTELDSALTHIEENVPSLAPEIASKLNVSETI